MADVDRARRVLIFRSVSASGTAESENQHQHPECIHVGLEGRLDLHLLSDPLDGLVMCLRQRASIRCEVVRDVLQRVLILWTRRGYL